MCKELHTQAVELRQEHIRSIQAKTLQKKGADNLKLIDWNLKEIEKKVVSADNNGEELVKIGTIEIFANLTKKG